MKAPVKHLSFGRYRGLEIYFVPAEYCKNLVDSALYFFLAPEEQEALRLAGFTRNRQNATNRLPVLESTESDSPVVCDLKAAYNSFCEWTAHGFPPTAWSYTTLRFSVTSKTLFVRAEREGLELPQDQLNAAKALSVQERLIAARSGSPDKRTEAVWLSTIKAIEALYFGRESATDKDVSILSAMIDRELEI